MPKKSKAVVGNDSTFPKKWETKLPDGHLDKANAMSTEELKAALVEYEQDINQAEKDKEGDVNLTEAKQALKDLSGSYNDLIKARKAMVKYSVYLLESRGAA